MPLVFFVSHFQPRVTTHSIGPVVSRIVYRMLAGVVHVTAAVDWAMCRRCIGRGIRFLASQCTSSISRVLWKAPRRTIQRRWRPLLAASYRAKMSSYLAVELLTMYVAGPLHHRVGRYEETAMLVGRDVGLGAFWHTENQDEYRQGGSQRDIDERWPCRSV